MDNSINALLLVDNSINALLLVDNSINALLLVDNSTNALLLVDNSINALLLVDVVHFTHRFPLLPTWPTGSLFLSLTFLANYGRDGKPTQANRLTWQGLKCNNVSAGTPDAPFLTLKWRFGVQQVKVLGAK